MRETKGLIRFLVYLFAPIALIFAGAGLVSWGFGSDLNWLGPVLSLSASGFYGELVVLLISIGNTGFFG